jgi:hypothetical protein
LKSKSLQSCIIKYCPKMFLEICNNCPAQHYFVLCMPVEVAVNSTHLNCTTYKKLITFFSLFFQFLLHFVRVFYPLLLKLWKFRCAVETNDVVSSLKYMMIELPCKMWIKQCENHFWKTEYSDPLRKII